jgi:hypothetical protein
MSRLLTRDVLGWGLLLWLVGYLLGFVFYAFVPPQLIGWFVMPLAIALTYFVLWRWIRVDSSHKAVLLGIGWSVIAIGADYLFIVKLLNPPDGYYKLDVYLYYLITLALPVAAAWLQRGARSAANG